METRICRLCKKSKLIEAFEFKNHSLSIRVLTCKECQKYQSEYYLLNKSQYKASKQRHEDKISEYIRNVKDNPCTDCGQRYPTWVMQFDHLDEYEKSFNLSKGHKVGSLKKVMEEIAKCELVCANCHAQRTHDRRMTTITNGGLV